MSHSSPTVLEPRAPNLETNDAPVIALTDVVVRYGARTALDHLTCTVRGRAVGLLGPNGAGKSTLISTLLGFLRPAAGAARLMGEDVAQHGRALRARIGYMPENEAFIADMSAVSFVRMMGELSGLPPAAALERAHEALFYVGLGEVRYRALKTYSLGMQQMAKLAQAIAHGPQLLILDEPTNSLDPPGRERMIRLIGEIRRQPGMHIVLCSHLLRDVEETCDEVIILNHGRLVHQTRLHAEPEANPRLVEIEPQGSPDDTAGFVAALIEAGCEVASSGRRLKAVLPPGTDMREIFRAAAARGLPLRRVQARRDTLEDIFLRAMEAEGSAAGVSRPEGGVG